MSDLVELTRKLAEVTAEVAGDFVLMLKCEAVIIAQRTRIAQLEALLPCAYLLGQEDRDRYILNSDPKKRRNPTPTSAELLAQLKETSHD